MFNAEKDLGDLMHKEGVRSFQFTSENGLVRVSNFIYEPIANRKEKASRYGDLVCWNLAAFSADSKPCVGSVSQVFGTMKMRFSPYK